MNLYTEINIAVFHREYKRVEKVSKLHSDNLNNSKTNYYSNPNFSHLINYKLLKHTLVNTDAYKSIIVVKNVPTNLLCQK